MSTVLEVIPLEGIDLEGSPPCELKCPYPYICGKPSVARVILSCPCGRNEREFICASCLSKLLAGRGACGDCWRYTPGIDGYC